MGLLPSQLWAKPNEYEKYSRLLIGGIQRYNDIESGFKEWSGRILRDAYYRKKEFYLDLESLRQWMMGHSDMFKSKVNLQHLLTSLYARVFHYLYPRRVLANAYCEKYKNNTNILNKFRKYVTAKSPEEKQNAKAALKQILDETFPNTLDSINKLKDVYQDDWETIVDDTKARLITNASYYHKMLHSEESIIYLEGEIVDSNIEIIEEGLS